MWPFDFMPPFWGYFPMSFSVLDLLLFPWPLGTPTLFLLGFTPGGLTFPPFPLDLKWEPILPLEIGRLTNRLIYIILLLWKFTVIFQLSGVEPMYLKHCISSEMSPCWFSTILLQSLPRDYGPVSSRGEDWRPRKRGRRGRGRAPSTVLVQPWFRPLGGDGLGRARTDGAGAWKEGKRVFCYSWVIFL